MNHPKRRRAEGAPDSRVGQLWEWRGEAQWGDALLLVVGPGAHDEQGDFAHGCLNLLTGAFDCWYEDLKPWEEHSRFRRAFK